MFGRHSRPHHQSNFAAGAAIAIVTGVLCAPALAATSSEIPCPKTTEANLSVPDHVLVAESVNHNIPASSITVDDTGAKTEAAPANILLAPRAEAAIRKAFDPARTAPMAGTESKVKPASSDDEIAEIDSRMNTKLPGVSDDDFMRYKKQMFRRDI